ncbi:MAG: Fic family protein [Candidatus Roizmanbacteria bacterium]|nr:Fic family protein [Candidatus Roizmanbacteria bacterium]
MKLTKIKKISGLFSQYVQKKRGKESLLSMVNEVEMAERVYNSNAIENSTLTLPETEKILLLQDISRHTTLREVFEAKNLSLVYGYVSNIASKQPLTIDVILLMHKMLLTNISDEIAGRFRTRGEMVRVGNHIGLPPKFIVDQISEALDQCQSEIGTPIIHRVAQFHALFESIHPFIDGNGRIGRVINNYILIKAGFPPIILRNKEKNDYYNALRSYDDSQRLESMYIIIEMAVLESLHKRLAYLDGKEIIPLAVYGKKNKRSIYTLLNAAKRQTIPAFREKGVWKIGV